MSTRDINPFVHLAAGSIGGSIGVILTSPIELVKTRQQSSVSSYASMKVIALSKDRSLVNLCSQIIKNEGYRSLFKGLTPSLAAVVPTKAVFFYINAKSRQVLANFLHQGQVINLTAEWLEMYDIKSLNSMQRIFYESKLKRGMICIKRQREIYEMKRERERDVQWEKRVYGQANHNNICKIYHFSMA
eukprot:sb/3471252/